MRSIDESSETTLTTNEDSGVLFSVSIEYETEISRDGGYSFERETATHEMTISDAKILRDELSKFLS